MRQGNALLYSIVAGWIITALLAFFVATVLVSEESRSPYFWHRLSWTEFLVLLFWGSNGMYLLASYKGNDQVTRFGGIAPTISMVTSIYCMLSFAAMVIHAFGPQTDVGSSIHLVIQASSLGGAAMCVVYLSMARAGAAAGLDFDKAKALSPRELHDLLALQESSLSPSNEGSKGLTAATKRLRETLLHSFNESAALALSPQYQSLSSEVQELCRAIEVEQDNSYGLLTETVNKLSVKAKSVSINQARR